MTQKKINGYLILMKEVLGRGSYGSVKISLARCTGASKMVQNENVPSRSLRKKWVSINLAS